MIEKLLLPHKFKKLGWMLLIPATILGFVAILGDFEALALETKVFAIFYDSGIVDTKSFGFIETSITNTIIGVFFIIGALMVSFSREKQEDEFIANLRLSSLMWAVLVNYGLLLFCFIFIYGMAFLDVMIYNMFTVLIIFILRFNYLLILNSKALVDEQ